MGEVTGEQTQVIVKRGADAVTLYLSGEIDLSNANLIRTAVDGLDASELERLVVDARDLRFMDSSGLAALVFLANSSVDGTLTIHQPTSVIRRLIEISGLSSIMSVEHA